MQGFRYASEPKPAGGLIGDSLSFFRAVLTLVWPLALLAALVATVPAQWGTSGLQWVPGSALPPGATLRTVAGTLLSLVGLFIVGSALLHQMDQLAQDRDAPAGASFAVALRATPSLLLAMVALCGVGLLLGAVIGAVVGAAAAAIGFVPAALAGAALALVFLVVFVRLAFMQQAIVLGGVSGAASLGASWRMTRGSVLRVLLVLLLVGVVGVVWILVASVAAGILGGLARAIGGATAGTLVTGIVTIGVYAVYLPFTMAAGLVVWNDLGRRAPAPPPVVPA